MDDITYQRLKEPLDGVITGFGKMVCEDLRDSGHTPTPAFEKALRASMDRCLRQIADGAREQILRPILEEAREMARETARRMVEEERKIADGARPRRPRKGKAATTK